MEGRDSSPSPAEEESLSATAALAKEAAVLFQSRRFSECVDVLKQLLQKKENDPKVLHNIAVSEYFSESSSDPIGPKKLLGILEKTKEKCEELARASKEKGDGGAGGNVRGSSILLNQISASSGGLIAYGDESDTTIPNLNTALVLYHLHEYPSALAIVEKLYEMIDGIDETTALNVCFLLLDIAFTIQDAKRAADVIQYLEKSFGISTITNQTDNGTLGQPQPANPPKPPVKSISAPSDNSSADPTALQNASSMDDPAIHGRNANDEEYENLFSSLDSDRLFLTERFSKTPTDLASIATHADLKVKLQLFKVRLLLLTRNLKVAKRELKLAMNMARGRDSSTELLLKSQLEYARGNHRKAVKLLSLPPGNRTDPATAAMFYNNLGCILHQQGSHQTASMLFYKALKESSVLHSKPLKLNLFSQDKSCLISYNMGLQHLIFGKPLMAARCFREAIPFLSNRPLFWLRFAECGLLALEMGLLPESSHVKEAITVKVAGSGRLRKLVVNGCEGLKLEEIDGLQLISLPRAREYLVNAMLLIQVSESDAMFVGTPDDAASDQSQTRASGQKTTTSGSTDSKAPTPTSGSGQAGSVNGVMSGGSSMNATLLSSVVSYAKICEKENLKIKQAVFADLSYVDLCLKNPLRALKFARLLIQLPECSRKYLFLGHVYAAEALCLLNRLKEAAELLSIFIEGENSVILPFNEEDEPDSWILDREKEREGDGDESVIDAVVTKQMSESKRILAPVLKPEEARAMLFVNLSVVAAMQGNVEQAATFVKQAFSTLPENPRVVLASVYIDLLKGNTEDALTKLRQCRNVRFQSTVCATD
ncbi:hypothetical protein LUZ63_006416 [Rhynchospora breviuscula]|uniref:CCR4-NOT transcription complex subunit 10 n=1 Tax=Rhynchospora breviuscula TaxID=2022672 RepID=A0A9Q0HTH3_9POAL|nr:hypothetical protein LUZ63_006416 [Rhynchospora breviuscula]